jgi:hypothetical protein
MDRLREIFDLDVPVERIFEAPTIRELAQSIERERPAGAAPSPAAGGASLDDASVDDASPDDATLDEALKLVENLSDDEVEALLKEAEAPQESEAGRG